MIGVIGSKTRELPAGHNVIGLDWLACSRLIEVLAVCGVRDKQVWQVGQSTTHSASFGVRCIEMMK